MITKQQALEALEELHDEATDCGTWAESNCYGPLKQYIEQQEEVASKGEGE